MLKRNKGLVSIYTLLFVVVMSVPTQAMHIMEGFLSPIWCIAWGILCIPFLLIGIKKSKDMVAKDKELIILLAMSGAFSFVLSALKIPSVTGSSSHMTGLGFAAILFGPSVASLLSLVVLLFQALLLAHGGLTTLGANIFSMGIMGPIVVFLIYKLFEKSKMPKNVNIFIAVALGDLFTYVITSFQLALNYVDQAGGFISSFAKFIGVFGITQIPLAIIEGALTVILFNTIRSYSQNEFKTLKDF